MKLAMKVTTKTLKNKKFYKFSKNKAILPSMKTTKIRNLIKNLRIYLSMQLSLKSLKLLMIILKLLIFQ